MAPIVVITGVSSGIGLATAKRFLANPQALVFGSIRKRKDVNRICHVLKTKRFIPLLFDVTDAKAIQLAVQKVTHVIKKHTATKINYLISNAGMITRAPLLLEKQRDFNHQWQVNFLGSVQVIRAFLPLLLKKKSTKSLELQKRNRGSRIIIINSINGMISLPLHAAYCASKSALFAVAKSWDLELQLYGVRVISVLPGPTQTAMRHKVQRADMQRIFKSDYGQWMKRIFHNYIQTDKNRGKAEHVAQCVYRACTSRFPAPYYVSTPNPLLYWWLPRLLPLRILHYLLRVHK